MRLGGPSVLILCSDSQVGDSYVLPKYSILAEASEQGQTSEHCTRPLEHS